MNCRDYRLYACNSRKSRCQVSKGQKMVKIRATTSFYIKLRSSYTTACSRNTGSSSRTFETRKNQHTVYCRAMCQSSSLLSIGFPKTQILKYKIIALEIFWRVPARNLIKNLKANLVKAVTFIPLGVGHISIDE